MNHKIKVPDANMTSMTWCIRIVMNHKIKVPDAIIFHYTPKII